MKSPHIGTHSIQSKMSNFMESGVGPNADFFDPDSSGDEGAWEDGSGTRNFCDVRWLEIQDSVVSANLDDSGEEDHEDGFADASEGQGWQGGGARAKTTHTGKELMHDYTNDDEEASPTRNGKHAHIHCRGNKKAHQMSLRRLGQVKVVHNIGSRSSRTCTPRKSVLSEARSSATSQLSNFNKNVITMRALESLPGTKPFSTVHPPGKGRRHSHSVPQPTFQKSIPTRPKSDRHIKIASITTTYEGDPDRLNHLPDHFIKTPYPFSTEKEFPKPRTRPQKHDFDNVAGNGDERVYEGVKESEHSSVHDQAKVKHILGIMVSEGTFDLRSRAERNKDAQGVVRSEVVPKSQQEQYGNNYTRKHINGDGGCMVYVSLRARRDGDGDGGVVDQLVRLAIPADLITTSPSPEEREQKPKPGSFEKSRRMTGNHNRERTVTHDFDDAFLATSLQHAYRKLAGNWLWRTFSARILRGVRLGQINVWSGSRSTDTAATRALLSVRGGIEISGASSDLISPFTEHNLLNLYNNPREGKARYTWVHWAKRVVASNGSFKLGQSSYTRGKRRSAGKCHPYVSSGEESTSEDDFPLISRSYHSDTLTTIQFTHSFSPLRIIFALAIILILSVLAALLWIFLGNSAWNLPNWRGRLERVGTGMAIGALAVVLQMVAFVAWLVGSSFWY
jgi:hypothetical protein